MNTLVTVPMFLVIFPMATVAIVAFGFGFLVGKGRP